MRPAKSSQTEALVFSLIIGLGIVCVIAAAVFSVDFIQNKAPYPREAAEIAALSAALESYKADRGYYPSNAITASLSPNRDFSPSAYIPGSCVLYKALSGAGGGKVYFEFSRNMLATNSAGEVYVVDPHLNSYGYAYPGAKNGAGFYDLWSTKGGTTAGQTNKWVGNW